MSEHESRAWFASAFTLIEMLVVIAIIGILAGILLPVIGMARAKARIAQARSDVAGLEQALTTYTMDFGALPPDSNAGLSSATADFSAMDTPNECLIWFLTRTYSRAVTGAGCPWGSWPVAPASCPAVFARVAGGPYFSPKAKYVRDYDSDNFSEFVDPWGRPYMYHARPSTLGATVTVTGTGPYVLTLTLAGMTGLTGTVGEVDLLDSGGLTLASGTYAGRADDQIEVTLPSSPGGITQVQFRLHNAEGGDVYSLGPDGLTRAASMPREGTVPSEWKPASGAAEIAKWTQVWGTPGDGNDIEGSGSNVITDPKHRDDINNWQ